MLVMAGANAHGLHLFWLTASGFEKSAFFPSDSFPEPKAIARGETIQAILSIDGKQVVHEVLWWGP